MRRFIVAAFVVLALAAIATSAMAQNGTINPLSTQTRTR